MTDLHTDPVAQELSASAVGELICADPRELVIGPNVRGEVVLDRGFVRSVRDRGVQEPITAHRDSDDRLVVRKGKKRTLAACETGQESVPVRILPGLPPEADDRDGQIARIVDQLEENLHRCGNTDAEEVAAHQQLLDLGLTAGQIARRTHTGTKRVRATTAIAGSAHATTALGSGQVTLEQALVLAEFDDGTDDSQAVLEQLDNAATTDQFAHVAQRLRDEQEDARLVAEHLAGLTEAGARILDDPADSAVQLSGLRPTVEDPSGTELTPDAHASCPGHAVTVDVRRSWAGEATVRVSYWCSDPTTYGHVARWDTTSTGGSSSTSGGAGGGRVPGPMSEEEKAERRRVIANNKAWDSATTVRADWLTQLLARRTPPKGAIQYVAAQLGGGGGDLRRAMESGNTGACRLLGMTPVSGWERGASPIATDATAAGAPRATMLALAVVLGAVEDGLGRHTWRNPTSRDRAYFTTLADWGYPLSEVEQIVTAEPTPASEVMPEVVTADGADDDPFQVDHKDDGVAVGDDAVVEASEEPEELSDGKHPTAA